MYKICIVGLGYIGLPLAALFASKDCRVVGIDANKARIREIEDLVKGNFSVEPGFLKYFENLKVINNLYISGNLSDPLMQECDVFIITVQTPIIPATHQADLTCVMSALAQISPFIKKGNLVVLMSTCPIGTTQNKVIPTLENLTGLSVANQELFITYCPERVLPGNILFEMQNTCRIIGGVNEASGKLGAEVYSLISNNIKITDDKTSEMVKLSENTFRDMNIAISNQLAKVANAENINIREVVELANYHPRVNLLSPGPGTGGHCLPVDPLFFNIDFFNMGRKINDSMAEYLCYLTKEYFPDCEKISLWGGTYKENVDDIRNSPTIRISRILRDNGYSVNIYDPFIPEHKYKQFKGIIFKDIVDALQDSDLLIWLLNHSCFVESPGSFKHCMRKLNVFDIRGKLNKSLWEKEGFVFKAL